MAKRSIWVLGEKMGGLMAASGIGLAGVFTSLRGSTDDYHGQIVGAFALTLIGVSVYMISAIAVFAGESDAATPKWMRALMPAIVAIAGGVLLAAGVLKPVAVLVLIAGAIWLVLEAMYRLPNVSLRMPSLTRIDSVDASGFTMRVPRRRSGRKQLKERTERLAADMFNYSREHPDNFFLRTMLPSDATEEERSAAWNKDMAEREEQRRLDTIDLVEKFGGELRYVLTELERFGVIPQGDAQSLAFSLNSASWIQDLATRLQTFARVLER